jgi:hypothetical protein
LFQGHPVAPHRKAAGITGFDLGLTKDKGSFHDVFSHTSYGTADLSFVWQVVLACHREDTGSIPDQSVLDL